MTLKTVLDSRELAFLIRQIDEYIQVMEILIPHGENTHAARL